MPTAQIILAHRVPHRLLRGHVWIYRSEIHRLVGTATDGDVVHVLDDHGQAIATGFYHAASTIAVRVFARRAIEPDRTFWTARIRAALAYRDQVLPGRPARRLINSEGDGLPGLIVDDYAGHLVIQTTTAGMDRRLEELVAILEDQLHPQSIIERNDLPVRRHERLALRSGVLRGNPVMPMRVRIGQVDFPCNPLDPHKTGAYLDQQVNWEAVGRLAAPGSRWLDAFCHLGGFGLHALAAGAAEVVAVDSAHASIAGAQVAAAWAGCSDRLNLVTANAFDLLRDREQSGERFDGIVLDPPSFTRSRETVEGALRGYKEIHLRALRMLRPGGVLATFSCSHHISQDAFLGMVLDAALDARRTLRRDLLVGASPDHPVVLGIPESEYPKGAIFSVVDPA